MPAVAGRTAHVAFQGDPDAVAGHTAVCEFAGGGADHWLRTADERRRVVRIEMGPPQQLTDHADVPAPVSVGLVDRHAGVRRDPALDFLPGDQIVRGARPDQHVDTAVRRGLGQRAQDQRPQRGEPDAARHDQHVPAARPLQLPTRAVRAADADDVADPGCTQPVGDRAHRTDRVRETPGGLHGTHRDGDLAAAETVHHRELPRQEVG